MADLDTPPQPNGQTTKVLSPTAAQPAMVDQNSDPQSSSSPASQLSPSDMATHHQLTQALHTLDLLNAQLGVAGALLVNQYHLQKQRETMAAPLSGAQAAGQQPVPAPYPNQYPPQAPLSGVQAGYPPQPQTPPSPYSPPPGYYPPPPPYQAPPQGYQPPPGYNPNQVKS